MEIIAAATVIFVAIAAIAIFAPGSIKKLFGAGAAQANKLANKAEAADPIAIIELKIDQAVERLREQKLVLAQAHSATLEVQNEIEVCKREQQDLDQRIDLCLDEGKDDRAATYQLKLTAVEGRLASLSARLLDQKARYDRFLAQVKQTEKDIVEQRQRAQDLGVDLKMSKSMAELAKLQQSFSAGGSPLDDLDKHTREAQRQINLNNSVGAVHADLNEGAIEQANEDKALRERQAAAALAERKAKRSLVVPPKEV